MDDLFDDEEIVEGTPVTSGEDVVVLLRMLAQRGIKLEGLAEDKRKLRLKLCARESYLSQKQVDILSKHFG